MTTLCSLEFNKMSKANVSSVACYFSVGSAQVLAERSQISGASMSSTPCRGDSVQDTPPACGQAACSSASPGSQRPSPKHHDHILALACRHSASPLHPLHHQVGSESLPRQTPPSQLSFALWRTCCWPCWSVQAHTSATIAAESLGQVFPRHRLFALGKL